MGVFRWVLRAVGGVVLLVGIAGLVVGRGGVVWSPVTHLAVGPGLAVTTSPGITAYSGGRLVVEATAPSGSLFIGMAHPVDVRSWLASTARTEITAVGPGGLQTRAVAAGAEATPPVVADKTAFWTESASGPTRQSLRVPLDGSPTQVVVMTTEATTAGIRVGLVTPGLSRLSGGAVLLGIALLAGSFVRRRRADGIPGPVLPTVTGDAVTRDTATGMAATNVVPPVTGRATDVSPSGRSLARGVRASRVLLAVLLVPALGGCGVIPERAEAWSAHDVTKVALTPAELPALFKDYDRRNNAAIAETRTSGDPLAWAAADTEVILDQDQFATHVATLRKKKEEAYGAMTHAADVVWAPEFGAYPMYAITSATVVVKGQKATNPDERSLDLWLRRSATEPWLAAGSGAGVTDLPQPLPAGEPATPAEADRALAQGGAKAIMAYLRTGKAGLVTADPALSHLATGGSVKGAPGHQVTINWWKPGAKEQVSVDGSVRAVRVREGVLAHASLVGREVYEDKIGLLKWNDKTYAKALGQPGAREELSRPIGVSVFYLVGVDRKVRVLASSWFVVR